MEELTPALLEKKSTLQRLKNESTDAGFTEFFCLKGMDFYQLQWRLDINKRQQDNHSSTG